jgi:hypothetical protein
VDEASAPSIPSEFRREASAILPNPKPEFFSNSRREIRCGLTIFGLAIGISYNQSILNLFGGFLIHFSSVRALKQVTGVRF